VKIGAQAAWKLKGQAKWLEVTPAPRPTVRLLPAFDPCLLGYRSRDWTLPTKYAWRVFPGGGLLRPALLVDGRVRGTWKIQQRRQTIEVLVEAFERLSIDAGRALKEEAEEIGHFLGAETRLTVVKTR
jgi:hypothetical protein